jgi:hypothetical protein
MSVSCSEEQRSNAMVSHRVFVSLFISSVFLAGCDMLSDSSHELRVAEYAEFLLKSNSIRRPADPKQEEFTSLWTYSVTGKLPSLFIELPDGKRYLLSEVPEEEIAKFFVRDTSWPGTGHVYRSDDRTNTEIMIEFREGKPVDLYLRSTDGVPILFSPTKEGPYYKLPIDRETLLKAFGEPVKWGRTSPTGHV